MEGRIAEVPLGPGDLTVGEDIDLVGGREMTRGYVLQAICQITGQKSNKIWPRIRQKGDMSDNRPENEQNLAKYQTRQKRTKKKKGCLI